MRTAQTFKKYKEFRAKKRKGCLCDFCAKRTPPARTYKHWRVIKNRFPYDRIAEAHDLLIPIRHFACEYEMTAEERGELMRLKVEILPALRRYHTTLENFQIMRTVEHYHIHLIRFKGKGKR